METWSLMRSSLRIEFLQDYFQSVGNRVLSIDDVSGFFNSNAKSLRSLNQLVSLKQITSLTKYSLLKDVVFTDERQFSIKILSKM